MGLNVKTVSIMNIGFFQGIELGVRIAITFRYNRRKSLSRGLLFQRVMEQAVKHEPIMYSEINTTSTGKGEKHSGKN